jgi:hypothetical protein
MLPWTGAQAATGLQTQLTAAAGQLQELTELCSECDTCGRASLIGSTCLRGSVLLLCALLPLLPQEASGCRPTQMCACQW